MTGNTFAHWQRMKTNRATYNILDTDVGTADEDNNADEENSRIHKGWEPVFAFVPVALAEKLEPHHGGEVKGEAGDEKGGAESQEVVDELLAAVALFTHALLKLCDVPVGRGYVLHPTLGFIVVAAAADDRRARAPDLHPDFAVDSLEVLRRRCPRRRRRCKKRRVYHLCRP